MHSRRTSGLHVCRAGGTQPDARCGEEGAGIADTVRDADRFHLLGSLTAERVASKEAESEAARERFHGRLEKFAEPLSFANVFMLALTLQVLFHRRQKHFVEHGIFSMHFMSFALFSGILFSPAPALPAPRWGTFVLPFILAIVLWQFVYLIEGIRTFYYQDQIRDIRPKGNASERCSDGVRSEFGICHRRPDAGGGTGVVMT